MLEPDYYPLGMAAEKTGQTKEFLICLAAEYKLPLFVKLIGQVVTELEVCGDDGSGYIVDEYYITEICKVSSVTIQEYHNNRNTLFRYIERLSPNPHGYQYNLRDAIPLRNLTLFVSAEDVARLSKKEMAKTTLSETERNTMLKLIIGMAIDAYSYNPQNTRNSLTGDKNGLSARLQTHGININDDTIRKYLREAKELL